MALWSGAACVGLLVAIGGPVAAQTDPTEPTEPTVSTPTPETTVPASSTPPTTELPPTTEAPATTVPATVPAPTAPVSTRAPRTTVAPPDDADRPEPEAEPEDAQDEQAEETTTTTVPGEPVPVSLAPEPEAEDTSGDGGGIGYQTRMNLIIGALMVIAVAVSGLTVLYWRHSRPGVTTAAARPTRDDAGAATDGDWPDAGPPTEAIPAVDAPRGTAPVEVVADDGTRRATPGAEEGSADDAAHEAWEEGVEGVDWEYVEEEEWDEAWSLPDDSSAPDGAPERAGAVATVESPPTELVTLDDVRAPGPAEHGTVGDDV